MAMSSRKSPPSAPLGFSGFLDVATPDLLERVGVADDDPALIELEDAAALPLAQAAIDALAGAADHGAELALGQRQLGLGRAGGDAQQRVGEPHRQAEKGDLADLLVGAAQ